VAELPLELQGLIFGYLPFCIRIQLNKKYYHLYHHLCRPKEYESYTRHIITRDWGWVFQQLLQENYTKWHNHRHFLYRDTIFLTYLYFIHEWIQENQATQCQAI